MVWNMIDWFLRRLKFVLHPKVFAHSSLLSLLHYYHRWFGSRFVAFMDGTIWLNRWARQLLSCHLGYSMCLLCSLLWYHGFHWRLRRPAFVVGLSTSHSFPMVTAFVLFPFLEYTPAVVRIDTDVPLQNISMITWHEAVTCRVHSTCWRVDGLTLASRLTNEVEKKLFGHAVASFLLMPQHSLSDFASDYGTEGTHSAWSICSLLRDCDRAWHY